MRKLSLFGLRLMFFICVQVLIMNNASANNTLSQPRFNNAISTGSSLQNNSVQNLPNLPINPNFDINLGLGQFGSSSNHTEQISQSCGNRCCIYQDRFYSEGSIVQVAGNILLMCQADPNTFGAGSLRWQQLK